MVLLGTPPEGKVPEKKNTGLLKHSMQMRKLDHAQRNMQRHLPLWLLAFLQLRLGSPEKINNKDKSIKILRVKIISRLNAKTTVLH